MKKAIWGVLDPFAEQGSEAVLWCINDHARPGYEGILPLSNGEQLYVYTQKGKFLWKGTVDIDPRIRQIGPFWAHGVQRDVHPEQWASFFSHRHTACVIKNETWHTEQDISIALHSWIAHPRETWQRKSFLSSIAYSANYWGNRINQIDISSRIGGPIDWNDGNVSAHRELLLQPAIDRLGIWLEINKYLHLANAPKDWIINFLGENIEGLKHTETLIKLRQHAIEHCKNALNIDGFPNEPKQEK